MGSRITSFQTALPCLLASTTSNTSPQPRNYSHFHDLIHSEADWNDIWIHIHWADVAQKIFNLTITLVFLVLSPNHMVDGLMLIVWSTVWFLEVIPQGNLFHWKYSSAFGWRQAWIWVFLSVVRWCRISGMFLNMSSLSTWTWVPSSSLRLVNKYS